MSASLLSPQLRDKRLMFRRPQSLFKLAQHLGQVAGQERRAVQPQTGKNPRMPQTVRAGGEQLVFAVNQNMPANFLLEKQDDEVFRDLGGFVQIELVVEIDGSAGQGYLREHFGTAV